MGLVLAAGFCLTQMANATLLGQTVQVEWHFNDLGEVFSGSPVTVTADDSDLLNLTGNVSVDMGAEGFDVIFGDGVVFNSSGTFNGVVLSDLFWDGVPDGILTGLIIDTNVAAWNDSFATFSDHGATFNFLTVGSVSPSPGSFFNVAFETSHAVPEPSTLVLLSLSLVGLGFTRRKMNT